MKKLIFLFLLVTFLINAQETKYIDSNGEIKPNEVVYTFGNNVKLRSEPNTNSETILKIPIAKKLIVLEKSSEKMLYNGIHWNWYKVNYNNKIGYVLGGLLAQDTKTIDGDMYLVTLKSASDMYFVLIRLFSDAKFSEQMIKMDESFSINVFDSKGVPNVKNMIYINFQGESCGANSGGFYLFNNGSLKKAIHIKQFGDGGYWSYEKVIFPNEKGGIKGKIYYEKEVGEPIEETPDINRTKSQKETCEFIWQGKELKLNPLKNW